MLSVCRLSVCRKSVQASSNPNHDAQFLVALIAKPFGGDVNA